MPERCQENPGCTSVRRLHNTVRAVRAQFKHAESEGTANLHYVSELDPYRKAFIEAMDDDFGTPQALATLHDLARLVNRWLAEGRPLSRGTLSTIDAMFRELGGQILGIIPKELDTQGIQRELLQGLMDIILDIRQEYRTAEEWAQADALRDQVEKLGIVVEDRPEGPTWRIET